MSSQWMTTLLSKGLELEQSFKKNIEIAQSQLKKELETRGLNLSAADFAALVEEYSPMASRFALSSAMEFLKPFTAGLGFRVAKLTDTQIELVVPPRTRNLNEKGEIHEAVILAAASEASRLLWQRHAPLGDFQISTISTTIDILKKIDGEVRIRGELTETLREKTQAELRQKKTTTIEADLLVLDEKEQAVAQVAMKLGLEHTMALGSPKS